MFGHPAEEAIGGDIAMLLPGADIVAGERRREVEGRRKDGSIFPLDLSIAEWRTAQGRFFTGMLRDATERKRNEEELRRSHEELEARVAERTAQVEAVNRRLISEMAERGKAEEQLRQAQKMEAVGRLTGGIAHDFNNLLTVIGGNLDLLERRVSDPGLRRMAASAGQAASRAEKLTAQLLAFSRRAPLRPQALDVNDIVYGMDDLLRRTAGEQVELRLSLSGSVRPALADQNQLETALLNLVINARAATPPGGTVVVETRNVELLQGRDGAEPVAPGHYVQVSVIDTGHGMSPDVAARAFEPFFTTKPTGEGTGLGLSQVYGFVRQSGGHVEIESEEGRGTAVRLLLPAGTAALLVRHGENVATALPHGREKILLVEDEDEVRRFAAELLRELGYTVVEAVDSESGLRLLAEQSDFDLLFSDVVMPGRLSGLDLAHEARHLLPDLAILLASGYSAQIRIDEIARAGFSYLPKPFRVDTLARGVRTALDRTNSEAVASGD
jgi:signal transduction histidine kinase/ActR/RegA family two-component response regulator